MKFNELAMFTDHVAQAADFYRQLLGIAPEYQDEQIAIFKFNGMEILIHYKYQPGPGDLPPEDHVAFSTANLEAEVQRMQEAGYAVEHPPKDYDWGRSAYLRDPLGKLIELKQESGV